MSRGDRLDAGSDPDPDPGSGSGFGFGSGAGSDSGSGGPTWARRGQANLPILAVALVLLTGVTAAGVAVAEGALASADRDAGERRAAATAADGLVAADGPASRRENVLDRAVGGDRRGRRGGRAAGRRHRPQGPDRGRDPGRAGRP